MILYQESQYQKFYIDSNNVFSMKIPHEFRGITLKVTMILRKGLNITIFASAACAGIYASFTHGIV